MKSKLYCLGIFLITLAVAATHQNEFPRFLLGFELLLYVFLFAMVREMKRRVTARLRLPEAFGKKKGSLPVEVELENTGRLPVPEIRVELGYRDLYDGNCGSLSGTAMLDGRGRAALCFHMTSEYCGAAAFWIEKVTVSDYLGVFCGSCEKTEERLELSFLPLREQEADGLFGQTQFFSADGNMYEQYRSGDDPSETHDIREFRQGDPLHSIHWKMTAKTGDLLVREFSQPSENTTLVLYDLKKQEKDITREEWDHFLESAASLSDRLLRMGYVHDTVWMDGKTGEVRRMHIGSEEALDVMLSELLRASVYDRGEIAACYKEHYPEETPGEIIRISLLGKISRESGVKSL